MVYNLMKMSNVGPAAERGAPASPGSPDNPSPNIQHGRASGTIHDCGLELPTTDQAKKNCHVIKTKYFHRTLKTNYMRTHNRK
jgi:hypothetical protein